MNYTFLYNPKLVNLLATAQGLYGQLEAESDIPSLALRLIQQNQVLATHYSTSVEGNPLTQAEVTNIVLGDKVPTNKSEREVKNYFEVLNRASVLSKERKPLSLELTLNFHRDLMRDLQARNIGELRNGPIVVGHRFPIGSVVVKHNPPVHEQEELRKLLTGLFEDLEADQENHPLIQAGILHHEFVYIHPFFDGNGRIARLLTAYYLLLNRYEVTKYFVLDDYYDIDRLQYSDMLHSADLGDKTAWLEYFLEGIVYSLQAAMGRVHDLKRGEVESITGAKRVLVTKREEEVLQLILDKKAIKTQDVVHAFGVTRQQAQSLLYSLVKKGIVLKQGKTKSSYYELHAGLAGYKL